MPATGRYCRVVLLLASCGAFAVGFDVFLEDQVLTKIAGRSKAVQCVYIFG